MNCRKQLGLHLLASLLVSALVTLLVPALALAESLTVMKDKDSIRAQAQFFAKPVAEVKKGDVLNKLAVQGDWLQVEFGGKQGWIHKSAVSAPNVKFSNFLGMGKAQEASAEEVALAGKGFTPEVEAGFRSKHPEMNYTAVDMVERFEVPQAEFAAFLKEGGLHP